MAVQNKLKDLATYPESCVVVDIEIKDCRLELNRRKVLIPGSTQINKILHI